MNIKCDYILKFEKARIVTLYTIHMLVICYWMPLFAGLLKKIRVMTPVNMVCACIYFPHVLGSLDIMCHVCMLWCQVDHGCEKGSRTTFVQNKNKTSTVAKTVQYVTVATKQQTASPADQRKITVVGSKQLRVMITYAIISYFVALCAICMWVTYACSDVSPFCR